jgi:hypothetical protein
VYRLANTKNRMIKTARITAVIVTVVRVLRTGRFWFCGGRFGVEVTRELRLS